MGVLYAMLVFIAGVLFAIVSSLYAANSQASDTFTRRLLGLEFVVILPVFCEILGFACAPIGV